MYRLVGFLFRRLTIVSFLRIFCTQLNLKSPPKTGTGSFWFLWITGLYIHALHETRNHCSPHTTPHPAPTRTTLASTCPHALAFDYLRHVRTAGSARPALTLSSLLQSIALASHGSPSPLATTTPPALAASLGLSPSHAPCPGARFHIAVPWRLGFPCAATPSSCRGLATDGASGAPERRESCDGHHRQLGAHQPPEKRRTTVKFPRRATAP